MACVFEVDLLSLILFVTTLLLCIFFDVQYFISVAWVFIHGKVFKNKRGVFDTLSIGAICTTQDVDGLLRHKNNARFHRDLDFARYDFYFRTGFFQELVTKRKGLAVQGATVIRFRRPISIFSLYKVQTKLIYWQGRDYYLEHKFVTSDKFVRAVAISKQTASTGDAVEIIKGLAKDRYQEPEDLPEVKYYQQCLESMSVKLRKSD